MTMPTSFFCEQEIDIILLQEVNPNEFDLIRGYIAYTNVGINKRGAAMLTRDTIKLTNHAVAIRVVNGILLLRRLYTKYISTL